MLKNRKLDHIGFGTNNLEETVKWYTKELGFKVIGSCTAPDGTPIKFLKGPEFTYEIYQPVKGVNPKTAGKVDHIAFVSDDIEKDYKECMKKGYKESTKGIQGIPSAWKKGNRYFKVFSVSGEEIEFCQVL